MTLGLSSPWARRTGWLLAAAALWGVWTTLDRFASNHILFINHTQSLPNWAFMMRRGGDAQRGDIVFFSPPPSTLVKAHFGNNPDPFGKIVYGLGGDTIAHKGSAVLLRRKGEEEWHAIARMKPVSMRGETLEPGPVGTIPPDCFYVGSPHKDGFDSRYAAIGFVCRRQLIGIAEWSLL